MSTIRRIAVVGAGVIGTHHGLVISQLADRAELVAVADVELGRAERLATERGGRAFTTLSEALAAVDVDIVVVCTPTGRHAEVAIEALAAGKHVIVEKPADITVERTDDIIEARDKAGTLITVISQHRFDPATETTLAAIANGELGRVTSGIASIDWWRGQTYYDSGDWRGTWALDGGGALMNQGVHTVDLLVAALGRPVEVFAYTGTLAHERIEVEDVATGVVRFESGALGVLHATTAAYPGLSARLQVHGDRGSAVIDNDQLSFLHTTAPGAEPDDRLMGVTAQREMPTAGSNPGMLSDAHRLQYLNFLGALDGTEELRVDLETNRRSIAVITGAYESARTGKPVAL
ncbi:Gfo/Idh/MocA family protein [Actinoplanes friuliensis]|uniref:Oxidoreductase n=1 Tax=Actinoplanes friuliensis DSM 7358 TaxID=1246995 RepID=U5VXQ4_9ACTN|nr:Gfo/Idh/MocA family oxidoreductase [Actinoplanes friuliensis]AGZ41644.1 oxidoreductase [Actinoplanes friuliensis DSM 7358]